MLDQPRCRTAASEFLRMAASRVDRRSLATWLIEHYARTAVRASESRPRPSLATNGATPILASALESAVLRARNHALLTLETLTLAGPGEAMARALLVRDDVRVVTHHGRRMHVPVDRAQMSLAHRVASLFVADFLDEAEAYCYAHHCLACGALALTERPRHARDCLARDDRSIVTMGVDFFFQRTA